MNGRVGCILQFVIIVIFCVIQIFRGVITTFVELYLPLGAKLILFVVCVAIYSGCILLTVVNAVHFIRCLSIVRLISLIITVIVFLSVAFVPFTKLYINWSVDNNMAVRTDVTERLADGKYDENMIDVQEYIVWDPRVSYTGTVLFDGEKALFYLYQGWRKSIVLIYAPQGEPSPADFSDGLPAGYTRNITDIQRVSDSYYSAVIHIRDY